MKGVLNGLRPKLRGTLREAMHHVRIQARLRAIEKRSPILVHQMGKVGSSTVVATLNNLELGAPILHVHTLRAETLSRAVQRTRSSPPPFLPEHLLTSSALISKLEKGVFPCTVITLTREPISRAISFAFEDWQKKAPAARCANHALDASVMAVAVSDMLSTGSKHADPTAWFDAEVRSVFGVDVFSVPYDIEQGYVILKDAPISVLVMRMEDLDRALPKALHAALGVESSAVQVTRANEGGRSWYANSLRDVKQELRLPREVIDRVLSTRYVQHFYEGERDILRRRWQSLEKA